MTQPDVALTDFALAIECGVLGFLSSHRRAPDRWQRWGWRTLFAAAGTAALLGGLYHGFLLDATRRVYGAIWLVIFAAAGLASLACWTIASAVLARRGRIRDANLVGLLLFLIYLASALVRIQSFVSVLVATTVAAALLLAAYWSAYRRRHRGALVGIAGVALVLAGSAIQRSGFDLHPRFTADALYHVILGVSLYLLYVSAPALSKPSA